MRISPRPKYRKIVRKRRLRVWSKKAVAGSRREKEEKTQLSGERFPDTRACAIQFICTGDPHEVGRHDSTLAHRATSLRFMLRTLVARSRPKCWSRSSSSSSRNCASVDRSFDGFDRARIHSILRKESSHSPEISVGPRHSRSTFTKIRIFHGGRSRHVTSRVFYLFARVRRILRTNWHFFIWYDGTSLSSDDRGEWEG